MDELMHFLAMGGYAGFVWPAYGAAAIVLAGMALASLRAWRRQKRAWDAVERTALDHRQTIRRP